MLRLVIASLAACTVAVAAGTTAGAASHSTISVVMSGLDAPRGLAVGANGDLYVAEAGRGAPCAGSNELVLPPRNVTVCVGSTGAVSRLRHGRQERIATELPSWANKVTVPFPEIIGPSDVVVRGNGRLAVTVGWGGTPSARSAAAAGGQSFGSLLRLNPNGKVKHVVDISAYEGTANPAGGPLDSNPFGLLAEHGLTYIADAGANALLALDRRGDVSAAAVFPPIANPTGCFVPAPPPGFPAPRFSEPVPTAAARGPDGALYVSGLGGFPFCAGAATIWRVADGTVTPFLTGFKMIADLAWGDEGTLYLLQHASSPALVGGPGQLIRVAPDGTRTTIDTGGALTQPIGLAIGRDHALYVSNRSVFPGTGEVLRIVQ